jgi:pimeloyl-ACP methyl ester carboxylesterase
MKCDSPSFFAGAAIGVVALFCVGCTDMIVFQRPTSVPPFGQDATLLFVPGIGGWQTADEDWTHGIRAGGYDGKIEVCDWNEHLGPLQALWAHDRQQTHAQRIAARIRRLRSESPTVPIIVAAHSAGAGVAVRALQDLPTDVRVDTLILLAPALSQTYDLSPALRHVQDRAGALQRCRMCDRRSVKQLNCVFFATSSLPALSRDVKCSTKCSNPSHLIADCPLTRGRDARVVRPPCPDPPRRRVAQPLLHQGHSVLIMTLPSG